MNTIFIAIASMADKELIPTVKSALENADHPELLTFSIFVQDVKSPRSRLKKLIDKFGAKLKYEYVNLNDAKGVGYARHKTLQHLIPKVYKYCLQIDSHIMFIKSWDTEIVSLYENGKDYWGRFIYSVYPNNYGYRNKKVFLDTTETPASVRILQDEPGSTSKYSGTPRANYRGNEYGELTNYFCGGFMFGDSDIAYTYKLDPRILYNGEEPYMSILLYADDIKIVAPPKDIVFHDYMGVFENRRFSFFVDQDNETYKQYKEQFTNFREMINLSYSFLEEFFNGYVNGEFNEKLYKAHIEWAQKHTIPYKEEYFKDDSPWFD